MSNVDKLSSTHAETNKLCSFTLHKPFSFTDTVLLAPDKNSRLTLTNILRAGSSKLPQNHLINLNFDCKTGQLDLRLKLVDAVEVVPQWLSITKGRVTLRAVVRNRVALKTVSIEGTAQILGYRANMVVSYNFDSSKFTIKGNPISTTTKISRLLRITSSVNLKIPPVISTLSRVSYLGQIQKGVTTLAVRGMSGQNHVAFILQKLKTGRATAVVADIKQYRLRSLVNLAVGKDISDVPLFGALKIPRLGFSVATGQINSPLLPQLYTEGSPLQLIGSVLPRGVFARFNLNIAHKNTLVSLSDNTIKFQVVKSTTLTIVQLLKSIPNIQKSMDSLPQSVTRAFDSHISSFKFNPSKKLLSLQADVKEIVLVPNVLKLSGGTMSMAVVLTASPEITFKLYGVWSIGKVTVTTNIVFNRSTKQLHVIAKKKGSGMLDLTKLVKGEMILKQKLPSRLTTFDLKSVVGNIYKEGRYFIAMSGKISGGQMYLIFNKGHAGVNIALAATLTNFRFADLVKSATGKDISHVPYFRDLVAPSMAIVVSSGKIKSPMVSKLFTKGSLLHAFSASLPRGVTAQFHLKISNSRHILGSFANGVATFKIPKSIRITLQNLVGQVLKTSNTLQTLSPLLNKAIHANVESFVYNLASNTLTIHGSVDQFTIPPGLVKLTQVKVTHTSSLGRKIVTKSLLLSGSWRIGKVSLHISAFYNGKELIIKQQPPSSGKQLNFRQLINVLGIRGLSVPSTLPSFTFTGLSGQIRKDMTVLVINGKVGHKQVSVILIKPSKSDSIGALGFSIQKIHLAQFVKDITREDISKIPILGAIVVPDLMYMSSTGDISGTLLSTLRDKGSLLEHFKSGIKKGVQGAFKVQIETLGMIHVQIVNSKLVFSQPNANSISLEVLLSLFPAVKKLVSTLPIELSSILRAKIVSFSFDPKSKCLQINGALQKQFTAIPQLMTLAGVTLSLDVQLASMTRIKSFEISGTWIVKKLIVQTKVSYSTHTKKLVINGKTNNVNAGINIKDVISSISSVNIHIPPIMSSGTLREISGQQTGNNIFLSLSGSVGRGHIYVIYEKSASGSAVAFMGDMPQFKLSSLVSDISSVPFFGTLVAPRIGFTIASKEIITPFLATLFPLHSPLRTFGVSIPNGINAFFHTRIGSVTGLVVKYSKNVLELQIPNTAKLYMKNIFKLVPGLRNLINIIPRNLRSIGDARIVRIGLSVKGLKIELSGTVDAVKIVPSFLELKNVAFSFSGAIGATPKVKIIEFKGEWSLNGLKCKIDVTYDKILIFNAFPRSQKPLNVKAFIKQLSGVELSIPPRLSNLAIQRAVGKIEKGIISIVILAKISKGGKIGIVYQKSSHGSIVAFAADVQNFKLVDLLKAEGIDISGVPFFGKYTIPAISFVISSKKFVTSTLPNLKIPGVPKELFLDIIPKGVKGQFVASIGSAKGIKVEYSGHQLSMIVPSSASLSFKHLMASIPDLKGLMKTLPSVLTNILNAKVQSLVFNTRSKKLNAVLYFGTLNLVPKIITLKKITISLDIAIKPRVQSLSVGNAVSMRKNVKRQYETLLQSQRPISLPVLEEIADTQGFSIEQLTVKGEWAFRGVKLVIKGTYNGKTKELYIEGVPQSEKSSGIKVTDLIKELSGVGLSVPSFLSSMKVKKVTGSSIGESTTILLSASAGSTSISLIFQRKKTTAIAITAEIKSFKLSELIRIATGIDVSKVPFIGAFKIDSLAFTVSTRVISSPLLSKAYDSDSPLKYYKSTIPRGLTAYFKAEIGGKQGIEITYSQRLLECTVPKGKKLSLQGLLSEIPKMGSFMKALPSPLSDLLASELVMFRFYPPIKQIALSAKLKFITIIPKILRAKNLQLSLTLNLVGAKKGITSLDFSADWLLHGISIRIKVSYVRASKQIVISATPNQKGGLNIQQLIKGLTGRTIPLPSIINSVSLTKMVGKKSADVFTFIFSSSIAGRADVHLIYRNTGTGSSSVAIAAGIKSFKLAELIKYAVKIDISNVPFFGKFSVPSMAVVISQQDLNVPLLTEMLSKNNLFAKYGSKFPRGFSAKFDASIGGVKGIIGSLSKTEVSLVAPPKVKVTLNSLRSAINVRSLSLPPVLRDIMRIRIREIIFNIPQKKMTVDLFIGKITVFQKILVIKKTQLKLIGKFSTPKSFSAEAKGIITLVDKDYSVHIRRDSNTKKYVLSIETKVLPIYGIISKLGAAFLPGKLNRFLKKVFDVNILNAKIVYPFGATPQQMMISGTPQIFGMKTVHITAVVLKHQAKTIVIQKYSLQSINVAHFIKKLIGVSVDKVFLLNQNVKLEFIVSPVTLSGESLSIPEFRGYSIKEGVSFRAPLAWPSNCASNPFCGIVRKLVGGRTFTLEATITNVRLFTLRAIVGDLKIGGLVLQKAGVEVVFGKDLSIGLVGQIRLKKPPVTLKGAVRLMVGGVKLSASMSGCWHRAFNSPYLTICNLLLSMTLAPTPVGVEYGGKIELGKKSCGKVLYAESYVGINAVNPTQNYIYANFGPLTFRKFFAAFCLSVRLPRPLAESWFPKGIQMSNSLLGKYLPHAKITIPPGFRFKGTINILGLEAYAEIIINLPNRIYIKAGLSPLRIANAFKMYASRRDRSRGPYLLVDIRAGRHFPHIEVGGFVSVLGIEREGKLLISSSKYELKVTGRFLNLLDVGLRITAKYGSISRASYTVEGWFKNNLFHKLAQIVRNGLKKSAEIAKRFISAAQSKIRQTKAKFDRANAHLRHTLRKLENGKRSFNRAIAKVHRLRHRLSRVCHIQRCGSSKWQNTTFMSIVYT